MTSYIAASERGRAAALETNTTRRLVTVDRYEWKTDDLDRWWLRVIADCGHAVGHPQLVAGDGVVPSTVKWSLPIGKRKRCTRCPPPVKKSPPPDGERCTYDVSDTRHCSTRAAWQVTIASPIGNPAAWPLLCTKHLNYLTAEGYIVPIENGGTDVVVPFKREASK